MRKRFYVNIVLQLHAVTCPGVWLCMDSGYIEATIKTLGYFFRTSSMMPQFPLLCHDQFTMEGYFSSVGSMAELEDVLAAEQVEITLWQNGRRLAFFVGKLSDVMQRSVPKLCCEHNVNVQLLMQPSKAFPGIIAPKIELTAKIDLEDRRLTSHQRSGSINSRFSSKNLKSCSNILMSSHFPVTQRYYTECHQPEAATGSCMNFLEIKRRQHPVCHAHDRSSHSDQLSQENYSQHPEKEKESDQNSYKSNEIKQSNCSSLLSNVSYYSNHSTSTTGNSCKTNRTKRCRSSNSRVELPFLDDHQLHCKTCQRYRKVFPLPT